MQDFVWQQKAMMDNARHGEHQTPPSVSYLWAGAKKSATINDSGFGCRDTSLLAEMERFELSLRFCRTTAFRVFYSQHTLADFEKKCPILRVNALVRKKWLPSPFWLLPTVRNARELSERTNRTAIKHNNRKSP